MYYFLWTVFGKQVAARFDFRFPRFAFPRGNSVLALQQRRFLCQSLRPRGTWWVNSLGYKKTGLPDVIKSNTKTNY